MIGWVEPMCRVLQIAPSTWLHLERLRLCRVRHRRLRGAARRRFDGGAPRPPDEVVVPNDLERIVDRAPDPIAQEVDLNVATGASWLFLRQHRQQRPHN